MFLFNDYCQAYLNSTPHSCQADIFKYNSGSLKVKVIVLSLLVQIEVITTGQLG